MTFWLQLKLILWKNFVVRRRQKVRVAVELVWPLFLFLILMWVRTRGLRTNVEECHYTDKAMPSTGLLPFLQSFFCTFNNTCHRTQEESQVRSGDFSPESIAKLVKELQDLLGENATGDARPREEDTRQKFSLTVSNLERLSNSIQAVTKQSSYLNDTIFVRDILDSPESIAGEIVQNNITIDPLIINKLLSLELNSNFLPIHSNLLGDNAKSVFCDNVAMTDLVVNVDEFKLLQNDLCRLTNEEGKVVQNVFMNHLSSFGGKKELENYMKYGQNMSWDEWNNLRKSYKDVENTLHTLQYYSSVLDDSTPSLGSQRINFKNGSSLERAYSLLNNFLCGNSSNTTMEQFFNGGNVNRFDSIQDQFRERTKIKFQYDNSTSPKCNAIFQRMEEVPALSILWRIMKPFLVGKILYTPVTNATTELMKRVNASFYLFSVLKAFGSNMPLGRNEAKEQLLFLPLDDLKQISEFLNTSYGKELIYGVDGNNVDPQSVGQSQQIIQRLYQQASSNQNNSIATNIGQFLECIETDKVEGIHDVDAAEERGMQLLYYNKLWALIEFTDPGQESLNPYITYKIRMNTERLDNTEFIKNIFLRKGARARPAIDLKYITYGFAYLQDLIDHAIISQQTGREDPPGVILQQFPYPCYIDDEFILAISRTFPLFMVLSWVYTCSMIVKSIVYEKEERLKETMRVMGLGNGIHWLGWFIDSLIPMLFTIFLLTLILVYGKVLMNSDPLVIYMFLFCYSLSTIAQAFLISVFFSQANLAAASAGIIFFILYLPYPLLVRWMFRLAWYHKFLLSFSSNVAFGIGTSYMALYEEKGTGIQWDDLGQSPLYNDEFNISIVMVMLLVDALIYLILAWYIEAVFPGQYGIPKPWYFLFTLSYWTGKKITKVSDIPSNGVLQDQANENFEKDPEGLKVGVAIHDLRKVYSNGKVAVNGVSLNFYENQITSFLGHNGAGKTTTISILTGLFPPTSGTALINGHDIRTDMNMIRKNLGMCPQHNVLFNRLTVEEHLWFYGSLRSGGSSKEAIETEVDQMIYDLNLPHKRHSLSSDLSGGMQRKLSIAVAFIGGSRVVILDEPTSGVDPFSRRSIWELLLKYKSNRTVILTTHYMDEADLLGDRIAIIANGSLQCCGSSIFLKNRFGSGYHLTLEVSSSRLKPLPTFKFDQDGDISAVEEETVSKMTTYIEKIVRSVRLVEHIGTEISYILPEREDTSSLVKLCNSLDKDKASLGIASYGISDTSLEEIFLRVAEKDPVFGNTNGVQRGNWWTRLTRPSKSVSKAKGDAPDRSGRNSSVPIIDDLESLKKHPDNKYWRQFFALHTKRFHHSKRNPKAIFSELILPALFVCMSLVVTSIFPKLEERPPLDLSLWVYPSPRFMFYSKETNEDPWIGRYVENMKGLDGIGDKCIVINGTRDSDCLEVLDGGRGLSEPYVTSSYCNCNSGAQTCPANIGEPPPPSLTLASWDTMFDMTGSNISEWILNTWPKYEEHRYGGFSFGSRLKVPSLNIRDVIYSVYALREPGFLNFAKSMYPDRTNSSINNVKVWFNNVGWVSSVAYMNAINNLILRTSLPPEKAAERSSYGIHTVNHPMNFTSKQLNIEMIRQGGVSVLNAISVIFALSFVPASFTLYIITERISHSKHLQLVSGVNKLIFWLQELTWDLAAYTVSATLCVFIFLIFDEKAYVSSSNLPGLIALFILYGWACIPLMYPLSFLFKVPSSSFVALSCGNLFIGIITTITTFVLSAFDDKDLVRIGNILKEVFLLFPHFCLGDGLMKLATNHLATASLMNLDIEYESNVFEWGFLGKNLACMTSFGLILFLITLAIEYNVFSYFKRKAEIITTQRQEEDEDDVGKERNRVLHGDTSRDILVIKELSKVYSRNVIPSVDRVSVGVKRGECFGLLGLNGAGKTTTFKMLTGATKASSGDATVMGHSIRGQLEEVRSLLGYCPQFDALDPLLTPYEHLIFYARIRNIPSHVLQQRVDQLIREMGLGYYSDKLAGQLSGGNKRKLSTAIALIGNPPLIFLDEPTSGMDPKARRFLWSCIQDIVKGGGCVVLTSHSMEECQALCTRLTIMVSGRFRCLGSSQHLKMKYGKGHRVVVRCRVEQLAETKEKIHSVLPSMSLIEEHYNQLRYEFSELRLSRVFHELQRLKNSSLLQDFSISQTTLEEVFLRFAQEQQDEPMERKKKSYAKSCLHCCRGDK